MNEYSLEYLYSIWKKNKAKATVLASRRDVILTVDKLVDSSTLCYPEDFLSWLFVKYKGLTPTAGVDHIREFLDTISSSSLFYKACVNNFIPVELLVELKDEVDWKRVLKERYIPNSVLIKCYDFFRQRNECIEIITKVKPSEADLFIQCPGIFNWHTFLKNKSLSESDFDVLAKLFLGSDFWKSEQASFFWAALNNNNVGATFFERVCRDYNANITDNFLKSKLSEKFGDDVDFVLRNQDFFDPDYLFSSSPLLYHQYTDDEIERLVNGWNFRSSDSECRFLTCIFRSQDFSFSFFEKYSDDVFSVFENDVINAFIGQNESLAIDTKSKVMGVISFRDLF